MASQSERCAYCGREVRDAEYVPAVYDDFSWALEAEEHASDCEWVLTRAHRLEPDKLWVDPDGQSRMIEVHKPGGGAMFFTPGNDTGD